MSKVSMIHHINIQITDRQRTREWYEKVLGAEFLDRGPALNKRQLQLRIGTGEIHTSEYRTYGNLFPAFKEAFSLTEHQVPAADASVLTVAAGTAEFPFLGVVIEDRKHIWPALKEFLREDRWSR